MSAFSAPGASASAAGGAGPVHPDLLSPNWGFCRLCHEKGMKAPPAQPLLPFEETGMHIYWLPGQVTPPRLGVGKSGRKVWFRAQCRPRSPAQSVVASAGFSSYILYCEKRTGKSGKKTPGNGPLALQRKSFLPKAQGGGKVFLQASAKAKGHYES